MWPRSSRRQRRSAPDEDLVVVGVRGHVRGPRPGLFGGLADTGLIPAPDWNDGTGKNALTPPPDALVAAPLFQTTSPATPPLPSGCSTVPPTPVAFGDEAGKLTWASASGGPCWPQLPVDPWSPEATSTVMPAAAAEVSAWSTAVLN